MARPSRSTAKKESKPKGTRPSRTTKKENSIEFKEDNIIPTRSAPQKEKQPAQKGKTSRRKVEESDESDEEEPIDDTEEYSAETSEEELVDSDNLDDDDFNNSVKKRKRKSSPKKKQVSRKKKSKLDLEDSEEELAEGQEVVGTVVEAPKTGRVPPGQISQNTFDFLTKLKDPNCNDRTWFKLHEPVYRQVEREWKDFIDEFTPLLTEADEQIPVLPPNDVVHRIYRDIRFSNDKTPYKTNFSASFSRSGRKGIFAGYHLEVKPGGSLFAAGTWCPGKNELQTIRNNLLRSSRRLRQAINTPSFVGLFGKAEPNPKGKRQNIFGADDELKVAPKGIEKSHRDIDLLKCRSYAVVHYFEDKEVLDPNFKDEVKRVVAIARPFVHLLNDLMTVNQASESSSEGESEGDDEQGAN